MDADSFNELALRVLAGEASREDRQALDADLSANPARLEEFQQLKITYDVLRTTTPMADATHASTPPLPGYRLNELRTAVRQHFGPVAARSRDSAQHGIRWALRWLLAGGGLAALGLVLVFVLFANQSIEVGIYNSGLTRGDDTALSSRDLSSARLLTFDQDAPFDQWQNESLHWYQRAKIWVDNEHDLLHVVRRQQHGHVLMQALPLAPTLEGQRNQIRQTVESLEK